MRSWFRTPHQRVRVKRGRGRKRGAYTVSESTHEGQSVLSETLM